MRGKLDGPTEATPLLGSSQTMSSCTSPRAAAVAESAAAAATAMNDGATTPALSSSANATTHDSKHNTATLADDAEASRPAKRSKTSSTQSPAMSGTFRPPRLIVIPRARQTANPAANKHILHHALKKQARELQSVNRHLTPPHRRYPVPHHFPTTSPLNSSPPHRRRRRLHHALVTHLRRRRLGR